MFPRRIVASRAGAGNRQILEMQRREISIELARCGDAIGERAPGARLQRPGPQLSRQAPSFGPRALVQPRGQGIVDRRQSHLPSIMR
jgi:hypothetical protein